LFARWNRIDIILAALFIFGMGACSGFGGCSACGSVGPLPQGGLPANQTVEGGAQVRVTPQGFTKLTSILPGALESAFGSGFTIGGGTAAGIVTYCGGSGGHCTISVGFGSASTSVTTAQTLRVAVDANANTSLPLSFYYLIGTYTCSLGVTIDHIDANVDIALGIDNTTGELTINLADINNLTFTGVHTSGCGVLGDVVGDVVSFVSDILDSSIGQFAVQLLTPVINGLLQGLLPNPLGLAGELDIGQLLAGVSPGTQAEMEARLVPGGYVSLNGSGMSLGVITGINSDIDPTTRTGNRPDGVPYASEPSLCVPPLGTPNFGQAPYSLPLTSRQTFSLSPADQFNGNPDPGADIAMGLSQTTFDQLGHHLVTSGGMCLGIGTSFISQLNVGTIGILVPSLEELDTDNGKAPLLLVTRPQRELSFTIGDNTDTSPAVTIHISHLEVDFYAFLFERYVRAFTIDLTMDVGVNLAFSQMPDMPAQITPTLTGISANDVQVTVLNSEFVKETPQHLEMVLPSVFSLITPLLGNIPPITVPSFAGFSLNNLSIQHVTTSQDDFLALYASLGSSPMLVHLLGGGDFAHQALTDLDADVAPWTPQSAGRATLRSVVTPPPEQIRGALLKQPNGKLPAITFDVDQTDNLGRQLEWAWNFNGGMWHDFRVASPLVLSDPAFAWEGHFTIGLKSRVVGDYRTTSAEIDTPVIVDSVGPRILTDKATWDGDHYAVPVWDVVSEAHVDVGFGAFNADKPVSWMPAEQASITKQEIEDLKWIGNDTIKVFARDEVGNVSVAYVAPFHGTSGTSGCTCDTGRPGAGGIGLFLVVGALVLRRRRRALGAVTRRRLATAGMWMGVVALSSTMPACSCDNGTKSCEMDSDCSQESCPAGQLSFCIDNTCVCSDDIPPGEIGPYSSIAGSPDGTSFWVSAYAQTYGDLVVAQVNGGGKIDPVTWQWVDGVPNGPVTVPGSKIRGGISDNGPNVGMYTSIQVEPDGTPVVTYFDVDNASLKFAANVAGTWQIHTIDAGTGTLMPTSGSLVGMYTSLTLRGDDGRPGVAYLAHVQDANGLHAEVRYAAAQVPLPQSAADWQFWTVDTADITVDPNDVYPLPEGLGLWIASARNPMDQTPVVVYYDRAAGELKEAKLDATSGQFDPPVVLAGSNGVDEGWTPSVAVDATGVAHVAYVDATNDNLDYITDAPMATPQIVDNGYRVVGQTIDGLPKPTFDILADAKIVATGAGPMVAYQDGTTQELLLADVNAQSQWNHVSIAGATNPWPGAYGFFVGLILSQTQIVMSSWVIDQPTDDNWVEVFARAATTF
jgi:MYXO-CTERM domain-containing protein